MLNVFLNLILKVIFTAILSALAMVVMHLTDEYWIQKKRIKEKLAVQDIAMRAMAKKLDQIEKEMKERGE